MHSHEASLSPSTSPKTNEPPSTMERKYSAESTGSRDSSHTGGKLHRPPSGVSLSPHISLHKPKFLKPKKGLLHKLRSHDGFKPKKNSQEFQPSPRSSTDDTLRHVEVESVKSEKEASTQKRSLVRVFRSNGTFGTFACPADSTTEQLIKLATRKFFISDPENYKLMFRRPGRSTYFCTNDKPIEILHDITYKAGYTHDGREDLTFLGRFVLDLKGGEEHQEAFLAKPEKFLMVDWVDDRFPNYVTKNASKIEKLELYRCSINPLEELAPFASNVQTCRLRDCIHMDQSLSSAVSSFSMLQTLDLRSNGLKHLDIDFSRLPNLKALDVSGNCLEQLPESLSLCPLKSIFASTNSLTKFDAFVATLEELNLDYNLLTGFGPNISISVRLSRLHLAYNQLTRLPFQLEFIEALTFLDLTGNHISQLGQCRSLSVATLKLASNTCIQEDTPQRARQVRAPYFYLPNITVGDISNNRHSFVQTPYIPLITSLDLSGQDMSALGDTLLGNVPNLTFLNVSDNAFTSFPASISQCRNLSHLDISRNALANLPPEISTLEKLITLSLHSNNLKSLPSFFFKLTSLKNLNLSSNLFESLDFLDAKHHIESRRNSTNSWSTDEDDTSEVLPAIDGNYFHALESLSLADNRLTDDVLDQLVFVPNLRALNLSYNDLSEITVGTFSHLTQLRQLFLSGNRLGTLQQEEFDNLKYLKELYLNGNRLHSLPAEFSKLECLEVLDVSDNNLHYNVSNWPFDWNWRWNKQLKYLNFSNNKRLEIKRTDRSRKEDLTDFNVLPHLTVLGLIDVTVLHPSVPDQTEECRIRTYGSELNTVKFGIADVLGDSPLGINDIFIDHFRGVQEEVLVGMFDGQQRGSDHGNRISKLAQELTPGMFKRELSTNDSNIRDAMVRTFKSLHADIGNTAVLASNEASVSQPVHTLKFDSQDKFAGTGAALCYMRGNKAYISIVGGTQCLISSPDGNSTVLNEPHITSVESELKYVRRSGAVVIDKKIDGITEYTRLIGCYNLDTALNRTPTYVECTLHANDILIIACAEFWKYISFRTAADIVRGVSRDSALAALKLRDLAIAFGCTSRLMVMVLTPTDGHNSESSNRKRKQALPQDSLLARLGGEIAPPLGDVTLVFTDIRHSTFLWENMPAVMRNSIKIHNSIMRRTIRLMSGYEVKTEGDAFIVAFHTPIEALLWCLTVQQQLLVADWPAVLLESEEGCPVYKEETLIFQGLRVRMGLHHGHPLCEQDPITGRMDYFGPMVNKAARISGVANGGQITISYGLLQAINTSDEDPKSMRMLNELGYYNVEIGELKLKGIESPEHINILYPMSLKGRAAFEWDEPAPATISPPPIVHNNSLSSLWSHPPTPSVDLPMTGSSSDDLQLGRLMNTCHRLESMCTFLRTGRHPHIMLPDVSKFPDPEELVESLVSRIENATVAMTVHLATPDLDISQLIELLKSL